MLCSVVMKRKKSPYASKLSCSLPFVKRPSPNRPCAKRKRIRAAAANKIAAAAAASGLAASPAAGNKRVCAHQVQKKTPKAFVAFGVSYFVVCEPEKGKGKNRTVLRLKRGGFRFLPRLNIPGWKTAFAPTGVRLQTAAYPLLPNNSKGCRFPGLCKGHRFPEW